MRWQPSRAGSPRLISTTPPISQRSPLRPRGLAGELWISSRRWCSRRIHGIPQDYFDKGDPYFCHCAKTTRLSATPSARRQKAADEFQVALRRAEWFKPYTDETVRRWRGSGVKRLAVITPGFAADCLETLEEIGVENARIFPRGRRRAIRGDPMSQRQRRRDGGNRSRRAPGAWRMGGVKLGSVGLFKSEGARTGRPDHPAFQDTGSPRQWRTACRPR